MSNFSRTEPLFAITCGPAFSFGKVAVLLSLFSILQTCSPGSSSASDVPASTASASMASASMASANMAPASIAPAAASVLPRTHPTSNPPAPANQNVAETQYSWTWRSSFPGESTVRIRLFEIYRPSAIELTVISGSLLLYRDGDSVPFKTLKEGSSSAIRAQKSVVEFRTPGIDPIDVKSIELVSADSSVLFSLAVTAGGRPSETRTYSGEIRFLIDPRNPGSLLPINSVDLETYVAAVVTSEYGLDDLQGNMAMAVLARTYAIRSQGKFGDAYDHVDHSSSQVYHGVDNLKPQAIRAARLTTGLVLVYENELIEALYHAESGGHTADNETVWTGGKPIPYLRGAADPYANNSPYANWTFTASRSRLLAALKRSYGGTISGIQIGDVGSDGRVRSIIVLRKQGKLSIPANEFRLLFLRTFGQYSMKSTLFAVRRVGNSYRFDGQGFGHGVGLSQWGAHEMANQGFQYQDILSFYFANTQVVSVTDLSTPVLADASPLYDDARADTATPDSARTVVSDRAPVPIAPVVTKRRRTRRIGW